MRMKATLQRRCAATAAAKAIANRLASCAGVHFVWNYENKPGRNHVIYAIEAIWVRLSVCPSNVCGAWHSACVCRWVHVPLGDAKLEGQNAFLRTFVLKVSAKKMHQSGRDTRIRLIRLVGPKPSAGTAGAGAALTDAAASFELHSTRMHTMR